MWSRTVGEIIVIFPQQEAPVHVQRELPQTWNIRTVGRRPEHELRKQLDRSACTDPIHETAGWRPVRPGFGHVGPASWNQRIAEVRALLQALPLHVTKRSATAA